MSVIVARALPDARDGLKPVHRRILYAMHDMGVRTDAPYKKSARIVGEVLGKYHPHGDAAVYEAMARMAQTFSLRYLLVDGQGNFGSVDGDPPAAMRYTEARLAQAAAYMLTDIAKNTVDFGPNFDGALTEPSVLPAALPNLLVNGATGIAVGMATSIPPHNLTEVTAAMHYILENWDRLDDIGVEDLLHFVAGPDFPTGGLIVLQPEADGLVSAYGTGRGQVTIQARAHLEEMERGRNRIIVTELPYMTNKSALIERIADLAREEKIEGIADLRDESDRQGMRIVIELSKTADPERVLRDLLKHTPMQTTFSLILLALVEGEPRLLSLKTAMRVYLEHRIEIVRRRSRFDLERAQARLHILDGLRVALKNLDEVIQIIRKAADADAARDRLMKRFKLTEIQTNAILDMPLRRLAALERKKIDDEFREVAARIKDLENLLRSPIKMRAVVGDELREVQERFGDRRRTHILRLKPGQTTASLLTAADTVPDRAAWLHITQGGLISRTTTPELPAAMTGSASDEEGSGLGAHAPAWLVRVGSRDTLYLAAENGEAAALPVHAVPETNRPEEGAPFYKLSALNESHRLAAVFALPPEGRSARDAEAPETGAPGFILTVTRAGMVKKSALEELPGPSASCFTLVRINPGDRLGWARLTTGRDDLLLAADNGMAIRFSENEVRPMGLAAAGVMGMKLPAGSQVVGVGVVELGDQLALLISGGRARRTPLDEFPRQGRYGQGVQAWKPLPGERVAAAALVRGDEPLVVHPSEGEAVRILAKDLPRQNRLGRGAALAILKPLLPLQKGALPPEGAEVHLTAPWRSPYHVEAEIPIEITAAAAPPSRGRTIADLEEVDIRKPATKAPDGAQNAARTRKSGSGVKVIKKAASVEKAAEAEKPTAKTRAAAPASNSSGDKKPATPGKAAAGREGASASKIAAGTKTASRTATGTTKPTQLKPSSKAAPTTGKTAPASKTSTRNVKSVDRKTSPTVGSAAGKAAPPPKAAVSALKPAEVKAPSKSAAAPGTAVPAPKAAAGASKPVQAKTASKASTADTSSALKKNASPAAAKADSGQKPAASRSRKTSDSGAADKQSSGTSAATRTKITGARSSTKPSADQKPAADKGTQSKDQPVNKPPTKTIKVAPSTAARPTAKKTAPEAKPKPQPVKSTAKKPPATKTAPKESKKAAPPAPKSARPKSTGSSAGSRSAAKPAVKKKPAAPKPPGGENT